MCTTCGCSEGARATITDPATGQVSDADPEAAQHLHGHGHEYGDHDHTHAHDHAVGEGHAHPHVHARDYEQAHEHEHHHEHAHPHTHTQGRATVVTLEREVLERNNRLAERNRGWLEGRNILALNLVSSPGAGKTTLLERTILDLRHDVPISVVEGDQETQFDAERIRATGCCSIQVNTGTGCHLEAAMLATALKTLDPPVDSVVMIENVGNLVCPALFDLGEHAKVVILSVTEGVDKPLKYPHMFRASRLMILNKVDLLPYVNFDVDACIAYARRVNPDIEVLQLSATSGEGLDTWYRWLHARLAGGLEAAS